MIENSLTLKIPKSIVKFLPKFYLKKNLSIVIVILTVSSITYSQSGWINVSLPSPYFTHYSIQFVNSSTGFIFGQNGLIKKTTDAGQSWFPQISNTSVHIYESVSFNENLLFTVGYGGVMLKTTNQGTNWNVEMLYSAHSDIQIIDSTTGWAVGGIYKTTNSGTNWIRQEYAFGVNAEFETVYFINDQTGFIAGGHWVGHPPNTVNYWKRIDKTTNSGQNWTNVYDKYTGLWIINYINSISFISDDIGFAVDNKDTLLTTTNGGLNWTAQRLNYGAAYNKIYFSSINTGWILGSSGIILKTSNAGVNWFQQNSNVTAGLFDIYCYDNNSCWVVGSNNTILRTTDGGGGMFTGINNNQMTAKYFLKQNYPNPFNPVTNIKFDIPGRSNVKISIYDILGKELSVLVNEELSPGTFEVNWDASNYPSGVYIYKIIAGDYSESKKMVLIK